MDLGQMIQYTNALAQQNNEWSAKQAEKQMQFQKNLSDTAHAREVADLKAAGLNPVLSAHSNGASTPAGAMGGTDNGNIEAVVSLLTHFGETIAQATAKGAAHGASAGSAAKGSPISGLVDKLPVSSKEVYHNDLFSKKVADAAGLPADYDWSKNPAAKDYSDSFWNEVSDTVTQNTKIANALGSLLGIKSLETKTSKVKKVLQDKYGKEKGSRVYNWLTSPGGMIGTAIGKKLGLN